MSAQGKARTEQGPRTGVGTEPCAPGLMSLTVLRQEKGDPVVDSTSCPCV